MLVFTVVPPTYGNSFLGFSPSGLSALGLGHGLNQGRTALQRAWAWE